MRRTEAPSPAPVGARSGGGRDPWFALGAVLFLLGAPLAVVAWTLHRAEDGGNRWAIVLRVAAAAAAAGFAVSVARIRVFGISRLPEQLTARATAPDATTWEERHPGAMRSVAALMAVAALVPIAFLSRRAGAESFEYPRGAAIAFLLLAGLAADAIWSTEFGRDRFPSAWTRALVALGAALLAASPSLLYWRWSGLAPPWEGAWGEDGAWGAFRRVALEVAIGAAAAFAAPLLRCFRTERKGKGRA